MKTELELLWYVEFGWISRCGPDGRILESQSQDSGKLSIFYMESSRGYEQAGDAKWHSYLADWQFFIYVKHMPSVTAVPLLKYYPGEMKTDRCPHEDLTQMFTAALFVIASG